MKLLLVVTDQTADVELIWGVVENLGLAAGVVCAANGVDGLAFARALRPDLVLVDVKTPGLEGLETTRRLRADKGTVALSVITMLAQTTADARVGAVEAGCDGFLFKPINVELLRDLVRVYLT